MAQGNEITLRKYEDFLLGKVAFSIKGPSDIEKEPEGDDADIEEAKAERKRKIADAKQKEALAIVRYAVTDSSRRYGLYERGNYGTTQAR